MAGVPTGGTGVERSTAGVPSEQRYQSGEALAEWRSCEQVGNESPSTSPPYWDSDDDDGRGPKPYELYGTYTWNIVKFSQINKRELKSNTFEIGGHKWYILIYPQGCDVCNHLSLFLCVANHEKLLPGWRHFAQFTIAVVNKDPKKSKYSASDTLHRFIQREHDWGWKKFMELSKVLDGFINADTLIIQAQVQVIREREDRPFRCLDSPYRRELVRVYLTNVEQICRRFAEERQGKLGKLIADETRWSSFRAFWMAKDKKSRCDMSREKTGSILKELVKHFFIEKEVTSTLVMDSLYSGLKAIEGQPKVLKRKGKYLETEELPTAIVRMEKDTFVLVDDVLTLLERAAIEPLPPKDEKAPQNRTKDGSLGEEFNKDLFERDDRRLTELGRRTIEIYTLAHIFSKIEVAYREDVSLKRQEELIREEEMACSAESGQKGRRGATDKEKKSKKKQGKQKRSNRKGKDKGKDDKYDSIAQKIKMDQDIYTVEREDFVEADLKTAVEIFDPIEDIVSDASDSIECVPEILILDSEDRDMGPVNWDTDDISELHLPTEAGSSGISGLSSLQNGIEGRTSSVVDDSSSTCSSDSVPFVAVNGPNKANSGYQKNRRSPGRGTNNQSKATSDPAEWVKAEPSEPSNSILDVGCTIDASGSSNAHSVSQLANSVADGAEKRVVKEEETGSLHKSSVSKVNIKVSRDRASCAVSLPSSPSKNIPTTIQPAKLERKGNAANDLPMIKKSYPESYINKQADKSSRSENSPKKPTAQNTANTAKNTPTVPTICVTSRPLSAPLIPISMAAVSVGPAAQATPILPRSASLAGPFVHERPPQSYRNVIVGPGASTSIPYSQAPSPSFSFGMVNCHDVLPNQSSLWTEPPQRDLPVDREPLINNMQSFDSYRPMSVFPTGPSGRQAHHLLPDDFPHLDIINDLLEDEHTNYQGFGGGPHYLNHQASFPGAPCRRSYGDDWFQHGYGFSRTPYDARPCMVPQGMYANNGQVEDSGPLNQWEMGGSDLPFVSFGSTGCDLYGVAEYQNPSVVGVNGYTVFGPSSGL